MSAEFFNGIIADHAAAQLAVALRADTYRGWEIDRDFMNYWRAVHPDFDGESNTVQLSEPTRDALIAEIDLWIEEASL